MEGCVCGGGRYDLTFTCASTYPFPSHTQIAFLDSEPNPHTYTPLFCTLPPFPSTQKHIPLLHTHTHTHTHTHISLLHALTHHKNLEGKSVFTSHINCDTRVVSSVLIPTGDDPQLGYNIISTSVHCHLHSPFKEHIVPRPVNGRKWESFCCAAELHSSWCSPVDFYAHRAHSSQTWGIWEEKTRPYEKNM